MVQRAAACSEGDSESSAAAVPAKAASQREDAGQGQPGEQLNLDENALVFGMFADDPEPGVMIDVGVHGGSTTRPFLEQGWHVIGFEPDSTKHARLRRLAETQKRFTLITCALADESATGAPFYTSHESTGIASLIPFRDSHVKDSRVQVRTLAEVMDEIGLESVDYLKIDAEGFDYRVLRGFPFAKIKPRFVLAEFDDIKTTRMGYCTDDMGAFLIEQGYSVYMSQWDPVVRYGAQHTWRSIGKYPRSLDGGIGWGNFIAVLPGENERRLQRAMQPWV